MERSSKSEASSKGKGPSKGKGVDSGNWGAVDLAPEEIDVDAQKAVLASYKIAKDFLDKDNATKEQDTPDEKKVEQNTRRHKKKHAQKKCVQSEDSESSEEPVRKNKKRAGSELTPMSNTVTE